MSPFPREIKEILIHQVMSLKSGSMLLHVLAVAVARNAITTIPKKI
jgi:hypothetical protein